MDENRPEAKTDGQTPDQIPKIDLSDLDKGFQSLADIQQRIHEVAQGRRNQAIDAGFSQEMADSAYLQSTQFQMSLLLGGQLAGAQKPPNESVPEQKYVPLPITNFLFTIAFCCLTAWSWSVQYLPFAFSLLAIGYGLSAVQQLAERKLWKMHA